MPEDLVDPGIVTPNLFKPTISSEHIFPQNEIASAFNRLLDGFRTHRLSPGRNKSGVAFAKLVDWIVKPDSVAGGVQRLLTQYQGDRKVIEGFILEHQTFFEDCGIRFMLEGKENVEEEKLNWAQFNQYLAQDLFIIDQGTDIFMKENVEDFIDIFAKICNLETGTSAT